MNGVGLPLTHPQMSNFPLNHQLFMDDCHGDIIRGAQPITTTTPLGSGIKPPWPFIPATSPLSSSSPSPSSSSTSSSTIQKILADLLNPKNDMVAAFGQWPSLQQPCNPQSSSMNSFPSNWIGPGLPGHCPNDTRSFRVGDLFYQYAEHLGLNSGPLVLDTTRGELVDASKMTSKEILEAKALAASKSHSEAERRRRQRINNHLATLRTLLPSSTKTDKASLLAEVIDQVKTLKRQASEIHEYGTLPTDHDEVSVEKVVSSPDGSMLLRASVCCEDRPELITHLRDALDALRLKTLKVEISTMGGRIKNMFILREDDATQVEEDVALHRVKEALKSAMDGPPGGEMSPTSSNKRQRIASLESSGCN